MPDLRFDRVQPGASAALRDWQHIHNLIIPTAPLSLAEVEDRATRNHLEVAYADGVPAGNSTVRPPTGDPATAVVIARVLPTHRRLGYGDHLYRRALAVARDLGAHHIDTVVLASNDDGLRFAHHHGFTETDRYTLPGDTIPFIDLRLTQPPTDSE